MITFKRYIASLALVWISAQAFSAQPKTTLSAGEEDEVSSSSASFECTLWDRTNLNKEHYEEFPLDENGKKEHPLADGSFKAHVGLYDRLLQVALLHPTDIKKSIHVSQEGRSLNLSLFDGLFMLFCRHE